MAKLIDELSKRINRKQSKYKTFSVKLKEEDIELLDKVSKATGMSKSELVEMSLRKEGLLDKKSVSRLLQSLEEVDEMEEDVVKELNKDDTIIQDNQSQTHFNY
jgi:cAMP phosphodiesterase